ncbi:MAG: SpoIVB peptidase [Bacillota bacterium]|nr:SpoIVB peptidase [Bacillota bacterium]
MKAFLRSRAALLCLMVLLLLAAAGGRLFFDVKAEDAAASLQSSGFLVPGGQSIGVTMDVKGVLVVGLEELETAEGGTVNPGLAAGLQIGDSILTVEGVAVNSAEEVAQVVNGLQSAVELKVRRKSETLDIQVEPVLSAEDGLYKIGVWVRARTAGLGTLTFYDPVQNTFGALGHAITDPVTGQLLRVDEGLLLHASVESVLQGKAGEPGEIRGIFYEAEEPLGQLSLNTEYGIFGSVYEAIENPYYTQAIPVASPKEVKKGPAVILATLEGDRMQEYDIEIEKVDRQSSAETKGLVLRVTDRELLEQTGGIVQGMSGSPIIQDGKLVGAVTHVFVNDPERGYGIFLQWMLSQVE